MFTGIIEIIGEVVAVSKAQSSMQLKIKCNYDFIKNVIIGDSIAVNGVCLTVTALDRSTTMSYFMADIMPETYNASNLKYLNTTNKLNLERALLATNGRLGGHFVSGHVDTIGKIIAINKLANAVYYTIKPEVLCLQYCINKGSITIDGASLTLFEIDTKNKTFKVSLIPHTQQNTTLASKKVLDIVNIEYDILAKYVESVLQYGHNSQHDVVGQNVQNVGSATNIQHHSYERLTKDFLNKYNF